MSHSSEHTASQMKPGNPTRSNAACHLCMLLKQWDMLQEMSGATDLQEHAACVQYCTRRIGKQQLILSTGAQAGLAALLAHLQGTEYP